MDDVINCIQGDNFSEEYRKGVVSSLFCTEEFSGAEIGFFSVRASTVVNNSSIHSLTSLSRT